MTPRPESRRLPTVVRLQLALALVGFCLFVYCLVDAIRTPEDEVRHLPKTVWLLIVLFFPFVGSIAWLVAGRPKKAPPRSGGGYSGGGSQFPGYDRPGRAAASNPDDDEEFLRQVRRRAEEQRRRVEEQRQREEQDGSPPPDDPV